MTCMTEQDVWARLVPLISEVTGAKEDQIRMESGLVQDLGAESVDLLDLSFLIEEHFGVTIEADEFERQASKRLTTGVYEKDGLLTAEAIEELQKALPELPPGRLKPGLRKTELPSLLNVAVFVHLIQRKLAEKTQEASHA